MAVVKTSTTEEISERLGHEFSIIISPQELKKITTFKLINIYCSLMNELGYSSDTFTEPGNFDAVHMIPNKDDYDEILPTVHFCLTLNKILKDSQCNLEVTHQDLYCPNWKKHRFVFSWLIHYICFSRSMNLLYAQRSEENVRMCERRKELAERRDQLTQEINKKIEIISHKKHVEKIHQSAEACNVKFNEVLIEKDAVKKKLVQAKEVLEEAVTTNATLLQELGQLNKEIETKSQAIIEDPEEAEKELELLQEKIKNTQLEFNYKNAEDAKLKNQLLVDVDKKDMFFLTNLENVYEALSIELDLFRAKSLCHQKKKEKLIESENSTKELGKKLAQLKEERVHILGGKEKHWMQLKEARTDKELQLNDLESQVQHYSDLKRSNDEKQVEMLKEQKKMELAISHIDEKTQIVNQKLNEIMHHYNEWEASCLSERDKLLEKVGYMRKIFYNYVEEKCNRK